MEKLGYRHVHLDAEQTRLHAEKLKAHHAGMASWGIREGRVLDWMESVATTARILEVGSGSGALAAMLLKNGYRHITLVDIDMYVSIPEARLLTFLRWDANTGRLPIDDGSMDAVLALQTVEHLENPWHAVREFARVLKPGGRLILTIPYGSSLPSRVKFLLHGNILGYERGNDHISFFPRAVLDKLLAPRFRLEREDWSEPIVKLFGHKLRLPRLPFFQRLLSRKVCYILERVDGGTEDMRWKPFSHVSTRES